MNNRTGVKWLASAAVAFGALIAAAATASADPGDTGGTGGTGQTSSDSGITSGGPVSGGGTIVRDHNLVGSNLADPNVDRFPIFNIKPDRAADTGESKTPPTTPKLPQTPTVTEAPPSLYDLYPEDF